MPDHRDTVYLGVHDLDRKRSVAEKIAMAAARFQQKFGHAPTVCLCHPDDAVAAGHVPGITIEARRYVGRSIFYIGVGEGR